MKPLSSAYVWLAVAVLIVGGLFLAMREPFTAEFNDNSQQQRAMALEDSSYTQQTNHFTPTPGPAPVLAGVPGKDQVNQFQAYVV